MSAQNPRPRSITDRLDALRFELKVDIADLRTEMAARFGEMRAEFGKVRTEMAQANAGLRGEIATLARDLAEFKGTVRGVGFAAVTVLPIVTAVLSTMLNRWFPAP